MPRIGPGEVLLRVSASGVCGSDVMEWYRRPMAPLVLGHEVAGFVEKVGAGVEPFQPGDRIVTTHHVPCNDCRFCRTDRHSVCETLHGTSFDPGGFAECVRLPAINVERGTFLLPGSVGFEEGSFVEPLACVVRGQRVAGLRSDDSVAVLGSGISGILHIQLARARGAGLIVATDTRAYRLEAARRFGADIALAADGDVVEKVLEANRGQLIDQVVVCTGARSAMEQALQLVERGGTILFFAPLAPGETLDVPVNALWKRGVTIVHSYAGPPDDMRKALELIEKGEIDVSSMITHRMELARTQEAFGLVAEAGDSLKVIVEPQR